MASTLPPELLDAIVGYFHAAKENITVQSIALVCREWNSISRPHLFRKVIVCGDDDAEIFTQILNDAPGIGQVVHKLVVKGGPVYGDCGVEFLELVTSTVLTRLPNLNTVTWADLELTEHSSVVSSYLSNLTNITHLRVRRCRLAISVLWKYVCVCPSIQSLDIATYTTTWERNPESLVLTTCPASQLVSLKVHGSEDLNVLATLVKDSTWIKSLSSLSVTTTSWDLTVLKALLRDLGPTLEVLDLNYSAYRPFAGQFIF